MQLDFGKGFTVSYLPAKKHASNWAWVKKLEHSIIPRKRLKTWNQKWKWARANEEALDFWEYVALHWSCDLCKAWLAKKTNWETYSVSYLSIGLFCMSFSIWNLICIFQSLLFVCSNCWIHLSFWFSFSKIFQNTDNFIICLQSNFFIGLICFGLNSKERTSSSATYSTRQVSVADGTKFFLIHISTPWYLAWHAKNTWTFSILLKVYLVHEICCYFIQECMLLFIACNCSS